MVFKPYFQKNIKYTHATPFFTSTQLATIYQYPTPNSSLKTVVGIVSFGGGLIGKVSPAGVLTDGDVQAHWTYLGIPPKNFPQVVIVPLDGMKNKPNPEDDATIENTIDVETIGAMYPSSNLTILLYIVPNSLDGFSAFLHATTFPVTVNGQVYKPSVISCAWGASEQDLIVDEVSAINVQLKALASAGITMTAASSVNTNVEFPSSSPFSLACGGTRLVCPNRVYDAQTVETAWSTGLSDISLVADPATGVMYIVGGTLHVIGGTSITASAMAAFLAIVNSKQFIKPLLTCYPPTDFHPIVGSQGYGSIIGTNLSKSILTPHVPVTGISLNTTLFTVNIGSAFTLVPFVLPSNASNKSVQYSSSDTSIATVNSSGLVKGISAGSVTITVKTVSGDFSIASVGTVPVVIPTSISVAPLSVNVNAGRTTTLTATVLPSTSSNKTVRWSSSNTGIATVNLLGMVTGVGNGTATITAVTVSGEIQGESTVTVSTPVTGISVLPTSVTITVGETIEIVPTVKPPTASNKTVNWTSSNKLIATVNSLGEIRGVKRGNTSVLATAGAYGATIKVVVK